MLIIGFGDSITAGVHLRTEDSYLAQLGGRLGCRTFNAGVPGQTTEDALPRVEADVINRKPDLCILQFGMNDHVASTAHSSKVPLPQYRDNLRHMINLLSACGIKPIVCTIHPIIEGDSESYYYARHPQQWYSPTGAADWINHYNEAIRDQARQSGCLIADIDRCWKQQIDNGMKLTDLLRTVENSGTDDGVHPTPLGHQLYMNCIADQLEANRLTSL